MTIEDDIPHAKPPNAMLAAYQALKRGSPLDHKEHYRSLATKAYLQLTVSRSVKVVEPAEDAKPRAIAFP